MAVKDVKTRRGAKTLSGPGSVETEIAAKLAAAGCRLRQDKVVLRLVGGVRAGIARECSPAEINLFTITAPIKNPVKTIKALIRLLPEIPIGGLRTTLHGNVVHARRIGRVSTDGPRVFGFVHNPNDEAGLILDLAESIFNDRAPVRSTK
jgi:hypothetical protein